MSRFDIFELRGVLCASVDWRRELRMHSDEGSRVIDQIWDDCLARLIIVRMEDDYCVINAYGLVSKFADKDAAIVAAVLQTSQMV